MLPQLTSLAQLIALDIVASGISGPLYCQ